MPAQPIAIKSTGLVTSVGLSAPATCAAIRAKISNPTETRFMGSDGEWIMAHEVPLEKPWRGLAKLSRMATMAIAECLEGVPHEEWGKLPLLLCVAEKERPGRVEGLDDQLFLEMQEGLGTRFAPDSAIVAYGRVSAAIALMQARRLIHDRNFDHVLIVAADSLLTWSAIGHYERVGRLLTAENSNGFIVGEGAGAILLSRPSGRSEVVCTGLGMRMEAAHIDSEEPLRGDGLTMAIKAALAEAGCNMGDVDFRLTDLSGEQYYFKEAALALGRLLRTHKTEFEIWHPAECIGEQGAAVGVALLALADMACRKGFAQGTRILAHMANDNGQRIALVLEFTGAQ